ncbi:MAG: HutD family protein [Aliidongia sp.]
MWLRRGAFSSLPGIDRILTLIEGAGFDLDFGAHGSVTPVLPFVPIAFSGDWPAAADCMRGPLARFQRDGRARPVGGGRHGPARRTGRLRRTGRSFLYVAQGHVALDAPDYPRHIASNELLVIDAVALSVTVSGCALKIGITAL